MNLLFFHNIYYIYFPRNKLPVVDILDEIYCSLLPFNKTTKNYYWKLNLISETDETIMARKKKTGRENNLSTECEIKNPHGTKSKPLSCVKREITHETNA